MLAFAMMAAIRNRANTAMAMPKKPRRPGSDDTKARPLVASGNPVHSHTPATTAHQPRIRHRLVTLATRSPSRRTESSPQETAL